MAPTTESYRKLLEDHLLSILQEGPQELHELIKAAEGAFPLDVVEALDFLAMCGQITKRENVVQITAGAKARTHPHVGFTPIGLLKANRDVEEEFSKLHKHLSEPHPLDYDWRFTADSITRLTDILERDVKSNARIALLGTPTLHAFLARRGGQVTLFDRSKSLLNDLRKLGFSDNLVQHDLLIPFEDAYPAFDIAVADPPWYPEHYNAFILRAAELLRTGGVLLLSVLPWLTRPSAIEDRASTISNSLSAGFHLIQLIPCFLSYETPSYERATLRKHGLEYGSWRQGDLFLFHYVNKAERSSASLVPEEEEWDEFLIGKVKVKLKRRMNAVAGRFSCKPVQGETPILDTVSRRDPLRSSIDLWTSRNAAYSVEGIDILREALSGLEHHRNAIQIADELAKKHSLSESNKQNLISVLNELVKSNESTSL